MLKPRARPNGEDPRSAAPAAAMPRRSVKKRVSAAPAEEGALPRSEAGALGRRALATPQRRLTRAAAPAPAPPPQHRPAGGGGAGCRPAGPRSGAPVHRGACAIYCARPRAPAPSAASASFSSWRCSSFCRFRSLLIRACSLFRSLRTSLLRASAPGPESSAGAGGGARRVGFGNASRGEDKAATAAAVAVSWS